MLETSPPVTRLITFLISPGPVKVAVWPVAMPNFSKLWNRLAPRRVPRSALISIWPPCRLTLGPTEPSVTICAWTGAAASNAASSNGLSLCERTPSDIDCLVRLNATTSNSSAGSRRKGSRGRSWPLYMLQLGGASDPQPVIAVRAVFSVRLYVQFQVLQPYGLTSTPLPARFRQSSVSGGCVFCGEDVQFCA